MARSRGGTAAGACTAFATGGGALLSCGVETTERHHSKVRRLQGGAVEVKRPPHPTARYDRFSFDITNMLAPAAHGTTQQDGEHELVVAVTDPTECVLLSFDEPRLALN